MSKAGDCLIIDLDGFDTTEEDTNCSLVFTETAFDAV